MKKGNYFGTEVGAKWWNRYRAPGFFARGNGEFSMADAGIHFLRLGRGSLLYLRTPAEL